MQLTNFPSSGHVQYIVMFTLHHADWSTNRSHLTNRCSYFSYNIIVQHDKRQRVIKLLLSPTVTIGDYITPFYSEGTGPVFVLWFTRSVIMSTRLPMNVVLGAVIGVMSEHYYLLWWWVSMPGLQAMKYSTVDFKVCLLILNIHICLYNIFGIKSWKTVIHRKTTTTKILSMDVYMTCLWWVTEVISPFPLFNVK